MRFWNRAWFALSWVLACCTRAPVPCNAADACAEGLECLAHRCVPLSSEPVAEEGKRSVARITELAVIAESTSYQGQLPGAISFGARQTGDVEVLLRFEPVWQKTGRLSHAFLLFEPAPRSRPGPSPVPIDVWRIEEPWSAGELSWLQQPELGHPRAQGMASASGAPLRIDVTRLVQHLQSHPHQDHGIAVRARATDGFGVSYASGVAGGRAPRIEVYSR